MTSAIGIKIANGEFYSILEENSHVKKRLVLTTVHDKQHSVQIDLYRSSTRTMTGAQYIGSLVVENIRSKPKGEPSIELVISSDKNGEINAEAVDLDTNQNGEHHVLNVSLKTLDEASRELDLPDFEVETNVEPPSGLYEQARKVREKESKPFPWMIVILVIAAILLLLALGFFFLGGKNKDQSASSAQSAPAPQQVQAPEPARAPPPPPAPVIQAPVAPPPAPPATVRTRPPAPVSSYRVPATIPREGVPYTIRWGDTLWEISEAFYRNPWLYPRIANFNNIRNPDLIIAGRTIRIPPRN
jgi:LysM repeat protein